MTRLVFEFIVTALSGFHLCKAIKVWQILISRGHTVAEVIIKSGMYCNLSKYLPRLLLHPSFRLLLLDVHPSNDTQLS